MLALSQWHGQRIALVKQPSFAKQLNRHARAAMFLLPEALLLGLNRIPKEDLAFAVLALLGMVVWSLVMNSSLLRSLREANGALKSARDCMDQQQELIKSMQEGAALRESESG
jgi:hypothetical protein